MIITDSLLDFFIETREQTEAICAPLEIEDYVVQPIEDVSPPKWHLGHTTWFFEEFVLKVFLDSYKAYDEDFSFIFNSYYETLGERVIRANRGNLSRPSVGKIYAYREHVDDYIRILLEKVNSGEVLEVLEIGIHHEKQHQELLLTDIKYILGNNPIFPKYSDFYKENEFEGVEKEWISIQENMYSIGHKTNEFCFDNELSRHKVFLQDFQISNKLVTNAEFTEFIDSDGYKNFELWHAEGWDWVKQNKIKAPYYWHKIHSKWYQYTLSGLQPMDMKAPVSHVSYYEAFAFSQFKNCRLPTEFEWEVAQQHFSWGKRWEWTESAYLPYPNYKKVEGALGEYNGKFMVNQKVLRGSSIATPIKHSRPTYRNFFHPHLRWQFTGIRLAK